jgi:hypothetical protein
MAANSWGRVCTPSYQCPSALLGWVLAATAAVSCAAQTAPAASYYEFGTVVAIGRQTVDLQTFDQQRQHLVQHSFAFSRESRADVVRVGDAVEVVYTPNATDWVIKRLIVLPSGVPVAGAPAPTESNPVHLGSTPASVVPNVSPVPISGQAPSSAAVPQPREAQLATAKTRPVKSHSRPVKPVPLPTAAPGGTGTSVIATNLASNAAPRTLPAVVPVDLGASAESKKGLLPRSSKEIAIDRPSEECNRSSADWPAQPLRLAVLDFRYPTEREEAHDIGTTGGGSGTAVADLVFARLEQLEQVDDRYAFSRGDRRRLDRSDFAGAARLGRQLGVDAVLAGTFVPVVPETQSPDDPTPPKTYELRAGIVDTCTGQLLLQTSSVDCPGGLEPGVTTGANPATCRRLSTTAKETADPKAHAAAYKPLLDDLLFPLEHPSVQAKSAAAGTVVAVEGNELTLHLRPHTGLRAGDQLEIHASRLAKNPTTYTLRNLEDEEIGRFSIRSVQGETARGVYTGDYVPRVGDTAEAVAN